MSLRQLSTAVYGLSSPFKGKSLGFFVQYIYIYTRTKPGIPTTTFEGQPELLEGGGSRTVRLELRDQQVTLRASRARASVPGPL